MKIEITFDKKENIVAMSGYDPSISEENGKRIMALLQGAVAEYNSPTNKKYCDYNCNCCENNDDCNYKDDNEPDEYDSELADRIWDYICGND